MRPRPADWKRMLVRSPWTIPVCSVLVAVVAIVDGGELGDYMILAWAVVTTILMVVVTRRHEGKVRRFMSGLTLSAILMCVGFVVRGIHGDLVGVESPIPSPADLLHIPAYLLFLRSAIFAHRARSPRRNIDAWLDAAAVLIALIIVLWVTFFADYALGDQVAVPTRLVNGIYNAIILVTFALFIRMTATPGSRSPVYYLLGTAGFAFFVVDLAASYSLVRHQGLWLTVALSPIVFGLTLQAMRHPDVTELLQRDLEAEVSVGLLRLSLIGAAIASPFVVLVFGRDQPDLSVAFLVIASTLLAVVVVARVWRLLIDQRNTALLDRRLATELALLAGLESREAIIKHLPLSAANVIGEDVAVDLVSKGIGRNIFPLPPVLAAGPIRWLQVAGLSESLPPAVRRVVSSLIRDTGLLVDSIRGLQAVARQRSEAEANERVAASERRFRALVERSTDMIVVVDRDRTVLYVSDAVESILGLTPDALVGRRFESLVHEKDVVAFADAVTTALESTDPQRWHELRFNASGDSSRLLRFVMTDMTDVEEVGGLVINATDVTDKRRLERDLLDARLTDRLTLLPNRTGFLERLELALRRISVTGLPLAVAIINIRDFKAINDALGPTVADQMLVRCGELIRHSSRVDDTVARLGGDEFVVLMRNARSPADAVYSAERIINSLNHGLTVAGQELQIGADGGVVFTVDSNVEALELLRDADIALTAAKQADSPSVVVFEPEMGLRATERLELRTGISRGLSTGEFSLVYQPVVSIQSGSIKSLEALARWQHPKLGLVPPSTFIEIAEESGQIDAVGEWAVRTACDQLVDWERQGLTGVPVSVNLSVHQLRRIDIVDRMVEIVENAGIAPDLITFEVTESALIDNSDLVAARLRSLRAAGFVLAIDDFGTGYSSLGYLQSYEFDILKIDKIFVDPLADPARRREREVVRTIISLARGLGAKTVAEGIESAEQLEVLSDLGCDYAQGFHLYRPLKVPNCTGMLRRHLGADRPAAVTPRH